MKLPKSWSEITIERFQDVRGVLNMRDMDNIDRNVHLLSALTGRPVEDIEEHTFAEILEAVGSISFMDTMPGPKAAKRFALKGKVFKVCLNPADLTAGQFADLTEFTKDKDAILENMHKILAVICLPMWKKYNGRTHAERAEFFLKHMPVSFAYSLALFFWNLLNASVTATENYLLLSAREQLSQAQELISKST